jgi:hypothetical protein
MPKKKDLKRLVRGRMQKTGESYTGARSRCKATPGKSVRMLWQDGTPAEAMFTAKGAGKSQVAIQHRKLASKAAADARKAAWSDALNRLAELLV